MTTKTKLSWNERFALIDHYKPTDERIVSALGVTQAELDTARQMRDRGMMAASKDLDVSAYNALFVEGGAATTESVTTTKKSVVKNVSKTSTSIKTDSDDLLPETATRKNSAPRKRGRKGTKITEAFRSIPANPTSVDDFAKKYGVSIPVLRQSKRFDTAPELGTVRVKRNKDSNVLEIWREPAATQA